MGLVFRDEPEQAEEIAAEAGDVGQHAVEPADVRCDVFDNQADVYHGKQGADAHCAPYPLAEEEEAGGDGEEHQRGINSDFGFGEREPGGLAHCDGDAFAGHRHGAAFDFEGNADAHHGATGPLRQRLQGQGVAHEGTGEPHVEVDEPSEEKADNQLEELQGFEVLAENEELAHDEYEIHENGVGADGPLRGEAGISCQ